MNIPSHDHHTPCSDGERRESPGSSDPGASVSQVALPATLPALADHADAVHEHGLADALRHQPQSRASLAHALHVLGYAVDDPDLTRTDCRKGICRQAPRVEVADDPASPTVAHPCDSDGEPDLAAPDPRAPDPRAPDPHAPDSHAPGTDGPEADHRSSDPPSAVESGFDPHAARLWLWAAGAPGAGRAIPSALTLAVASLVTRAHGEPLLEVLAELVDHTSEANLFGFDRHVSLWLDREADGRITGWYVTVELAGEALESPDGHRLRLAGTWAEPGALWTPECDPAGTEGLVAALARVADDADDTVARSWCALAPDGKRRARGH